MSAHAVQNIDAVQKNVAPAAVEPQTARASGPSPQSGAGLAAMFPAVRMTHGPAGVAADTDAEGIGEVIGAMWAKLISFVEGKAFYYDYKIKQLQKEYGQTERMLDGFFEDQKVAEDNVRVKTKELETIMADGKTLKESGGSENALRAMKRRAAEKMGEVENAKAQLAACVEAYGAAKQSLEAVQHKIQSVVRDLQKSKSQMKRGAQYNKVANVLRDAESFAGETKGMIESAREAEIRGKANLEAVSERSGVTADWEVHNARIDKIADTIEF